MEEANELTQQVKVPAATAATPVDRGDPSAILGTNMIERTDSYRKTPDLRVSGLSVFTHAYKEANKRVKKRKRGILKIKKQKPGTVAGVSEWP